MKTGQWFSIVLVAAMVSSSTAWAAVDPAELDNARQDRAGFQHQDVRVGGALQVGDNAGIQANNQARAALAGAPPVAGLQNAIEALPAGQRADAAGRAARVMNNPQAAAAINSLPEGQRAAAVMAVAAMPGTMDQKVAAARMLAAPGNAAVLAAVAGAAGGPVHQGQMLAVLANVPAGQQAAVANKLKTEPATTDTLARIPAGQRRAAMAIVGTIVAAGGNVDMLSVAKAVANPQARAVLATLAPADQVRFAPVLANAGIARAVANAPAGANRTAILETATTVAAAGNGIQRDRNLTALASALSTPAGQALMALAPAGRRDAANMLVQALNGAPAAQQGSIISAGIQVLGNANLRAGLANIPNAPAGQLAGAIKALASLPAATRTQLANLPARATAAILVAAAAAPANQQAAVMKAGTVAMASRPLAAAILALPAAQQATAMQALGNVSVQTRTALANLPAADLGIVVNAVVAAPASQRPGILAAGARAMADPASAAAIRALPAAQQGAAISVLGTTSGPARTNFLAALNAAPAAVRGDMLQTVAAAPPASRAFVMGSVTRAMSNAGIAGAIANLPQAQRGQAMRELGNPLISNRTRTAFGTALAGAPAAAQSVMIGAVLGVGGGPRGAQNQATMMGMVGRAMGNGAVRDAIMATPANQRTGLILALGRAGPAGDAARTRFAAAMAIPAINNLPRAQRATAAASIAAAPDGVRRFQALPPAAQTKVVNLAKAMGTPNGVVLSRAITLMGNATFARNLDRVPAGSQLRVLATAAGGRVVNPIGAVAQIANVRAGGQQQALANMWIRQNLPRDLLRM